MPKNKQSRTFSERMTLLKHRESDMNIDSLDVKELIHELQTYKIELEMQNEELRTAQSELEKSRNKYLSLFETAPVGFFTLDQNGLILEVNEKGAALLGFQQKRLVGQRFQQFVQPDHLTAFYNFFIGLQHSPKKGVSEVQLLNTSKFVQMEGVFFNDLSTQRFLCQLAIIDVTLRKKEEERYAEQKLSQQKEILNTILQTQEEERIRIAEALHNGLGQLLYATKLKLEDIRENKEVKAQIEDFLNEAITETRNLSFILMPSLLKDFGLKIILEETAKRFSTKAFKLTCEVQGLKQRLPNTIETIVFRMIQELLNNILRHAGATEANIFVKKQKRKLTIVVKDNGHGFCTDKAFAANNGTGLRSVYNRLELLNGTMNIVSKPGRGSLITINLSF